MINDGTINSNVENLLVCFKTTVILQCLRTLEILYFFETVQKAVMHFNCLTKIITLLVKQFSFK